MASFQSPCGVCMLHKAYMLHMEAMVDAMEMTAENRATLLQEADEHALPWAHRDAEATGGWAYLADAISDAGVYFFFGAAALGAGAPRENDVLADHIRSTGDLPASFHARHRWR